MSDFELSRLLVSLMLLLFCALALGQIFEMLRLPRVIGEISAGLLLGPSLFGFLAPDLQQSIFHAFSTQQELLSVFYWLGLILLMFSAGFKVNMSFEKCDGSLVFALVVGGIGLPLIFGFFSSTYVPNRTMSHELAFALVLATAAAVTSIPVLAKIFFDLGISSGRFARLTLTAAAIQDLILWTILSVALAIQLDKFIDTLETVKIFVTTFAFTGFAIFVTPTLIRLAGRIVATRSSADALLGYTVLICLVFVAFASVFHVNIIFGALLAGIVIRKFAALNMEEVRQSISNVAAWFFVPIYFSLVGFKVDLSAHLDWWLVAGFLFASSAVKVISVIFAARLARLTWRHTVDFGIVMNARGGPGIVLASIAYEAKIIDEYLLVTFIMTSLLTSLLAGLWLQWRNERESSRFA
jgi:Kef-type K+ transport system membrane component KefB